MVCEQTCPCRHEMDESMRQVFSTFDFTQSSHKWIQTILSCGKHSATMWQDSDFAGDLEDSKSTSGGILCIFGSHTFVPISWISKTQTSVSHSSTEAVIISLRRPTDGRYPSFGTLEVGHRSVSLHPKPTLLNQGFISTGKLVAPRHVEHTKEESNQSSNQAL